MFETAVLAVVVESAEPVVFETAVLEVVFGLAKSMVFPSQVQHYHKMSLLARFIRVYFLKLYSAFTRYDWSVFSVIESGLLCVGGDRAHRGPVSSCATAAPTRFRREDVDAVCALLCGKDHDGCAL